MIIEGAHTQSRGQADADGYTLTVEDVAEQIGKSVESVRRYIRTGRLPALKVEGKNTNEYRINPDDLSALYTRTQPHTQPPAHAGDRTGMGVSVEIAAVLAHVEQTQHQLYDEIAGLRSSMERLAVALENNTHVHTQAHDRVSAPPARTLTLGQRLARWLLGPTR